MGQAERNKRIAWVQALWHLSDLLAIAGGVGLGYWTRFYSPLIRLVPPEKGTPPVSQYLFGAAVTAAIWIPLMHWAGLYRLERGRPRHRPGEILRTQSIGWLAVAALSFFYRTASFSRLAVPLIWLFTYLFTLAGRAWVRMLLRRTGLLPPIRFAVIGTGPAADRLVRSLAASSYPHVSAARLTESETATVRERARSLNLDLVVLASAEVSAPLVQDLYAQCQELDLEFLFVPELFSVWSHPVRVEEVDGLPVLRLRALALTGWGGVLKRTIDLVISSVLLVLLSPLFCALAIAVRLDSNGPIFHRQERVGRDRRRFRMVKFRSMRLDAERESGPVWAAREDPRRTRVGAFLRRWSLDELPQLWNVFRGQMSLVGPRPERPLFVHRFEEKVADYYDRHRVKSGITGWAQVHGLRGDTPIEERTRYDLYYVEHWSIWLDFRILFLTGLAVFRHRGS